MSLNSVEMAEGTLAVQGGMRLGYTPRDDDPALLKLHAGDEITVFTEARLPNGWSHAASGLLPCLL